MHFQKRGIRRSKIPREKKTTRRGRGMKKKKKRDETSVFFVALFFLLAFVCLALPRVVLSSSFFVRATTTTTTTDSRRDDVPDDDEKDWKTRRSNCAAKGFDDPRAIRCEYCRFALKEALDDEEITRECLECCTETTTGGDPDANGVQLMMSSNRFDRATITACS